MGRCAGAVPRLGFAARLVEAWLRKMRLLGKIGTRMAENLRRAAVALWRRPMRWPVVYALAPLLAVGVALGLAATVAEEGKREQAGVEKEPVNAQQPVVREKAPERQPAVPAPRDADAVAAATPAEAEPPAAASSPPSETAEENTEGYVDPDAPVAEEATAGQHIGDFRDPDDIGSSVEETGSARHVGELLDPDAP